MNIIIPAKSPMVLKSMKAIKTRITAASNLFIPLRNFLKISEIWTKKGAMLLKAKDDLWVYYMPLSVKARIIHR